MRPQLSISSKITLAFVLGCLGIGAVVFMAVAQEQRTAMTLAELHEDHIPLALALGEAKASQTLFVTVLDRLNDEPDSASSISWIKVARQVRPGQLIRARFLVKHLSKRLSQHQGLPTTEMDHSLTQVQRLFAQGDHIFDMAMRTLATNQAMGLQQLRDARHLEQQAEMRLYRLNSAILAHIASLSSAAEATEKKGIVLLGGLSILALLLSLAVAFWARRMLAPLATLQKRVASIAHNTASERLLPVRQDEIGEVTREFEAMVDALSERDKLLLAASDHLKRLEEERARASRLAAVGRMAAHVTHEIRNPLSSIGLNLELLQEEISTPTREAQHLFRDIRAEIERLTELTQGYLQLARTQAPKSQPEAVDEVLTQVVEFVRPEFDTFQVDLALTITHRPLVSEIDESQLRQVLLNLLRNAREATGAGGHVWCTATVDADEIQITVTDDGHGIKEADLPLIFDAFYTTKDQGTGLGLALAHQIIQSHGGRLEYRERSDKQSGACFKILLPQSSVSKDMIQKAHQAA